MARIVVVATGGTIASTRSNDAGATATESISDLLEKAGASTHEVIGVDLMTKGSYLLTPRDLRLIIEEISTHVHNPNVDGIVVTHGTDTMEETSFLSHLCIDSSKPIIFTGAQQVFGSVGYDGARNLVDAIAVAGSDQARDLGSLIVFGGKIFSAKGVRKLHTLAPVPFGGSPELGLVNQGKVQLWCRTLPQKKLQLPQPSFDSTRVDVVASYPGVDAAMAEAAVSAGAQGVVLLGTGAGNANHALLEWVVSASSSGVAVGLSTRASEGPVEPLYGNGGAADLLAAGALNFHSLPWSQARLLLALLISQESHLDQVLIDSIVR